MWMLTLGTPDKCRKSNFIRKYPKHFFCNAYTGMFALSLMLVPLGANAQQYKIIHMSNGTGFFVSRDGYILTNEHVVSECKNAHVSGAGVDATAEIIQKDKVNDMALLRVRETPLAAAVFRASSLNMREGAPVVVIGHPLGGKLTTRPANFIANTGPLGQPEWLRFSNSVFQGNSGGPLLDASGQVIGMIMAKATTYRYNSGSAKNEVVGNADVAIQPYKIAEFLKQQNVRMQYDDAEIELSAERVTNTAKNFVVQIKCQVD